MTKKIKIMVVVGARPNFIKIAPLFWEFRKRPEFAPILIHTGQHYDYEMSRIFFKDLDIPAPDINLGIGSGTHAWQTGQSMIGLEKIMAEKKPGAVAVIGDVNATLAGSLAAAKLHIPVAHIEAGLRSFNKSMPEEINRVLTDHISDFLFCPTRNAIANLKREGIIKGVFNTGDIMLDVLNAKLKKCHPAILEKLGIEPKKYLLLTVHRAGNVDNAENFKKIIDAVSCIGEKVVFPTHPRTMAQLNNLDLKNFFAPQGNVIGIDPVGYMEMLSLEKNAKMILTDSGGVQKEAFWLKIPCVTLRNETEWVETVAIGANVLVGTDKEKIIRLAHHFVFPKTEKNYYGIGVAARKIADKLLDVLQ